MRQTFANIAVAFAGIALILDVGMLFDGWPSRAAIAFGHTSVLALIAALRAKA